MSVIGNLGSQMTVHLNELCKLEEEIQHYISTGKTEQNQSSCTYPGFGS